MWLLLILDVLDTRDTALAMSFTTILHEVLATIKIPYGWEFWMYTFILSYVLGNASAF